MQDALGRIEQAVSDIYDAVVEPSAQSIEALEQRVEERPIASLLIAFGLGWLVGRLLFR